MDHCSSFCGLIPTAHALVQMFRYTSFFNFPSEQGLPLVIHVICVLSYDSNQKISLLKELQPRVTVGNYLTTM